MLWPCCNFFSELQHFHVHFRPDSIGERVLKQRWCEAFLLGLAQCSSQFGLLETLTSVITHLGTCATLGQLKIDRFHQVKGQIDQLCHLLRQCQELNVTSAEFSFLKIIAFTASGEV